MIVNVLPLTSRMIILSLGVDTFRIILAGFWRESPPQLFASVEALALGNFLRKQDFPYAN